MKLDAIVEMDDGTVYQVTANSRDVRAWEATYRDSWITSQTTETQITQVIHLALTRTGQYGGTYAQFEAHADDVRATIMQALVADPTRPTATDDSSAPSLSRSAARPPRSTGKTRQPSPP